MNFKSIFRNLIILLVLLNGFVFASCQKNEPKTAYLFTYFTGNRTGEEAIRFAISEDGFNFRALNNNQPVIDSKDISSSGGVRDPHILRGPDGKFYMVVTDLHVPTMGWSNTAMTLLKSDDLINWTSSNINIPSAFPDKFSDVSRVWAPQTIYDSASGKYMVYFSMLQPGGYDIIYYAYTNKDFTELESAPKQLFFSPTNNACIDADIIEKDNKYYMFFKSENGNPGIKLAISEKVNEGYEMVSPERVDKETRNVEGSGVFKLNNSDDYILMYDVYMDGRYQFTKSSDLMNFEVIDNDISMNFHPRHGTVLPITQTELKRLIQKWGTLDDLMLKVTSDQARTQNVVVKGDKKTIYLPVKTNTDLTSFDPEFETIAGIEYEPKGAQDFSKGSVEYTFSIDGIGEAVYNVTASEDHNPVLSGFYADPDIMYSQKTGKYYIYPTSDGFTGWSGTYFKTFSSEDLVNWTDEGVILDLKKDVDWANRNAWAPCIVEKKINGEYKYFYYFTAAQKIGVAVADNPEGPFVDSGKALLTKNPGNRHWGQVIDPEVFTDPKTNKSYLYWGNGWCASAELNDDMVSIKENSLKMINVDKTYREGTTVIYRNGVYYFMWSEDDTRSPKYKVRYGYTDSPQGTLTIPEKNIVIQKRDVDEIYGTGHNSAIQIPGKDEWYLVYHRFTRPEGIDMPGGAGGFHREVCIDKLTFDEQGMINEVIPTTKGIQAVN